jgi:hypothetical protein
MINADVTMSSKADERDREPYCREAAYLNQGFDLGSARSNPLKVKSFVSSLMNSGRIPPSHRALL